MAARRRFIIVGMQRSGTTVTHVCLNGHPNVAMPSDEVMTTPFFTRGLATFTRGKESYAARKQGYAGLFDLITSLTGNEHTTTFGIKAAVGNHSEALDVCNCLREYLPDVAVILVSRDDLVAQCGSLARAEKSGEWHAWEGRKKSAREGTLAIEPSRFQAYAHECRHTMGQLRTLARTHDLLEFNYERDIANGVRHDRLFEFLGLPRVPVTWLRMTKVAPPARDFIENYDELTKLLARIPEPREEDELTAARARRSEAARSEAPNFLMTRGCDLLTQGDNLASATEDIRLALENEASPDAWMLGRAYGLLESAPNVADADALLAALASSHGDNPFFLLERARTRHMAGDRRPAHADTIQALTATSPLDALNRKHAFTMLERILVGLEDPALAADTIETLAATHATDANYLFLKGFVARHAGDAEAARAALQAALDADSEHARSRELLAVLDGSGPA